MMKKTVFLFMLAMSLVIGIANANEIKFDFSFSVAKGWSVSPDPTGFETSGSERGMQFSKAAVTLIYKGVSKVTEVVVVASSNSADQVVEVTVGGQSWGTQSLAKEANAEKSFSGAAIDGDIVVTITKGAKSSWVKSIIVTADEGGDGGDEGDDDELDPDYEYDEPTTLLPTGTVQSNKTYTFIQNNVKVYASTGGLSEEYFGCNAGNKITFTTTKAMKAIVINGFVKKDFSATASSGEIDYADAVDIEEGVFGEPVLIVKDIDNKSITLSCDKQMRCYSVDIYFDENPDIEIDNSGGEDDEYNYNYEPTTPKDITIKFDSLFYADYSEDLGYTYTSLYFVSDEYEMEMAAFVPSAKGTGIVPGEYPINETYEDGTIQASPGGDDYYDYPTYIATDFEYDEDFGLFYNTSYYLVGGTVKVENDTKGVKYTINARSYFGSNITATYIGTAKYDGEEPDGIEGVNADKGGKNMKRIENGRVVIYKDGRKFSVDGVERK